MAQSTHDQLTSALRAKTREKHGRTLVNHYFCLPFAANGTNVTYATAPRHRLPRYPRKSHDSHRSPDRELPRAPGLDTTSYDTLDKSAPQRIAARKGRQVKIVSLPRQRVKGQNHTP